MFKTYYGASNKIGVRGKAVPKTVTSTSYTYGEVNCYTLTDEELEYYRSLEAPKKEIKNRSIVIS